MLGVQSPYDHIFTCPHVHLSLLLAVALLEPVHEGPALGPDSGLEGRLPALLLHPGKDGRVLQHVLVVQQVQHLAEIRLD